MIKLKRPQSQILIKDQSGTITQHSIYDTSKEAQKVARELALLKVRGGMQTSSHSDKVYNFPDGYSVMVKKVVV